MSVHNGSRERPLADFSDRGDQVNYLWGDRRSSNVMRFFPKSLVLASPRSGRVRVAQHFSAGNRSATSPSPCNGRLINPRLGTALRIQPSVSRTVACDRADPTDESVGYFQSSASPTFAARPEQRTIAGPVLAFGKTYQMKLSP